MAEHGVVDKDKGWTAFIKRMIQMKGATVKVGVLAKEGAEHEEGSPLTKAEIAAVLEFGTKDGHIPARPALRSTFDEKRDAIRALSAKLMVGIVDGKVGVKQAMDILGAFLANATKGKITEGEGIPPPNAPSTIAAKGSDRPWVNTGAVVGAISWATEIPSNDNVLKTTVSSGRPSSGGGEH